MSYNTKRLGEQETVATNADLASGIHCLLTTALKADQNDEVLVIYDESFGRYFPLFQDATVALDLSTTFLHVPTRYKCHLAGKMSRNRDTDWLPYPIKNAIGASTVILNVLNGSLTTAPVRRAIVQQPRLRDARLAHIPGLSDEVLTIVAKTNFDQILDHCELLAWILGNGKVGQILTTTSGGVTHTLTLDLGGWDNEPLMSPGIIFPGSWGNFPPGEVFCCPDPNGINGSICINGSVPDLPLKPGQEVILEFRSGRLTSWQSDNCPDALNFFDRQNISSKDRGDDDWNVFAELGIGLNPAVEHLTGNSLFDEKAGSTIHIAIGDNTTFGSIVKSDIHADLVTWRPGFFLDGLELMRHGNLLIDAMKEIRKGWRPPPANLDKKTRLLVKEAEVHQERGLLVRRLCKGGRVGLVRMSTDNVAGALGSLFSLLQRSDNANLGDLLEDHPEVNEFDTSFLIDHLIHYRCVLYQQ
jgi:aminopeptidase